MPLMSRIGPELVTSSSKKALKMILILYISRASAGNLVKNMENMGIFLSKIWEVYGIFQKNMGGIWEKIRVHQTKANIQDKFESKFMHLNITMF